MRKLWVVALANLAVVGLVLTAIITNVVSACSSADGCGSAPPYMYVGLVLVLLCSAGLFLLFRKWRGSADTSDMVSAGEDGDEKPKRAGKKRADKASRAERREADAAEETVSRNRLGRIRSAAVGAAGSGDSLTPSDDADAMDKIADDTAVAADWPSDEAHQTIGSWSADDGDVADAEPDHMLVEHRGADWPPVTVSDDDFGHSDAPFVDGNDDPECGIAWAVDDAPAISPRAHDDSAPEAALDAAQVEPAVTLPLMPDDDADTSPADDANSGHISLSQIFARPLAVQDEVDPADTVATTPPLQQRFDDCAPAGFPATVSDLRALIDVLSLDILLDKQARGDIAAWAAVLAPLDDGDAVGPADCEAFAQWIDALAERHNADLAATVTHALQQRGGGDHDPYRSAA